MRHGDWARQSASNNRSDLEEHLEHAAQPDATGARASETPESPKKTQTPQKSQNRPDGENKPDQKPGESACLEASGNPEERPRGMSGCYTADEVLDGWRSHLPFRKVETGRGVKMPNPDPSSIAHAKPCSGDGDGVNREFAMWLHVEVFWERHFELHPQRPFVLLGQECDGYFRFCKWYAANPLVRAYGKLPDEGGTREYFELVIRPLREAVDTYNASTPKARRVTYGGALAAIKGDRLAATRPKGKWHTRVCDIEAWVGLDDVRGGVRENAGRKKAA